MMFLLIVYLITTIALVFILAGGTGNLIDRIFNEGRVIDFMNMGIGSIRTGIFNMADIAIAIGTIWLIFILIRHGNRNEKNL
jgi:signal peptidase II